MAVSYDERVRKSWAERSARKDDDFDLDEAAKKVDQDRLNCSIFTGSGSCLAVPALFRRLLASLSSRAVATRALCQHCPASGCVALHSRHIRPLRRRMGVRTKKGNGKETVV